MKSIEDHGYMLHFGPPSFTGFMPKDSQPGNISQPTFFEFIIYPMIKFSGSFETFVRVKL